MNDRAYWNRHARGYDLSLRVLGRPLPRMLELVTDAVRGRSRVLEVAAGTGVVTTAIAPAVGEVVATDYAEHMVARLSARVRDAGLSNVRCEQADIFALSYEPESFDAIVAANVFHLLLDTYGALKTLRRVLRPGGRVVFPTFCHGETLRSAALSRVLALTRIPGAPPLQRARAARDRAVVRPEGRADGDAVRPDPGVLRARGVLLSLGSRCACYEPGVPDKPRRTTARRIAGAFGAVLLLFALALVVMVVALEKIGAAEDEVARLDRAKHAGHHAAAMAREQYMHQAHTLLTWDGSHLDHYYEVAEHAKHAIHHLETEVAEHPGQRQAEEITRLILESDRRFREEVWPAIQRGERARMPELHAITERPVEAVVKLNTELNTSLEAESETARKAAERIRAQARFAVIACFALAIAAAAAVGFFLLRSISRPVAALQSGARRIGGGDLSARIGMTGDDELAELGRAFDQMAADLSRHQTQLLEAHRLASIGQVASGVAHELNNPLGVILGYLTLLRREPALVDREELRIIDDEVRQSQAIVAGLLELARPVQLHTSDVDLGEVAREVAARLEESGRADEVTIRVHASACPRVVADEGKLRQIVLNLVTNAVDAAREPSATAAEVEITCDERDRRVAVHVDDRGPGIASEVQARLFEPFFTTRPRGHGLGLAIARTLARAHGGDIELAARPDGAGTRATLILPIDATKELTA